MDTSPLHFRLPMPFSEQVCQSFFSLCVYVNVHVCVYTYRNDVGAVQDVAPYASAAAAVGSSR